ncbi:hypothetical protein [Candidatus Methylacidithermus pantelleriae]|uniref:hypothetical protein n=1 Tax=Candidatus Methylacidithermus pantelleriae TaxID=2744239 RepID=UPI00157E15A9|nr:hypothetical protein [Candidatus Methylacidithermus pantelleriae]
MVANPKWPPGDWDDKRKIFLELFRILVVLAGITLAARAMGGILRFFLFHMADL